MRTLWKRIEPTGLSLAGLVSLAEGGWSLWLANRTAAADVAALFGVAGAGLLLAAILILLRVGKDLARAILGALTAGAFAIGLVDLNLKPLDQAGRYGSIEPTLLVAVCLVLFAVFEGAYELGPVKSAMLNRLDRWLDMRIAGPNKQIDASPRRHTDDEVPPTSGV